MNPPASAPALAFILKGLTTIRWGTDGFLEDAGLIGAIVNSLKQSRMVDKSYIENNSGFKVATILLIQGQTYDITCTDDTAKSWPDTGNKVLVQGPDDTLALEFLVVEDSYSAAKKKEGERSFTAEFYTAYNII